MEYRFFQQYSDPTPYATITMDNVHAESYAEAIRTFCRRHGYRLTEQEEDAIWVEDSNGANVWYSFRADMDRR